MIRTFTAFKRGHANSPFTPFKRRSNDVQTRIQGHFRPFGPKRLALARRLRRSNVVQTTQTNVRINLGRHPPRLVAWCDELYAEKVKSNAEVPWLTLSAEELKTSPPLFRWPHARKDGFRSGVEPDSPENQKLMIAYVKKILEKLGASLEPPYAHVPPVALSWSPHDDLIATHCPSISGLRDFFAATASAS